MHQKLDLLRKWIVKTVLIPAGIFFTLACLFALTTGPFYLYHYLGTANSEYLFRPQVIIQLGSTPIPSEQALIRCYYTRQLALQYPGALIIVSQLKETNQSVEESAAWKMKEEIRRSDDSLSFALLTDAHSTREEVLLIKKRFPRILGKKVVLVTAPEHMLRAVAAFRRAGYQHIGGMPAFSWAGAADYRYHERKMGGRTMTPELGDNLQLRYQFWNHLRYELLCAREFLAFFWYRLRGWA